MHWLLPALITPASDASEADAPCSFRPEMEMASRHCAPAASYTVESVSCTRLLGAPTPPGAWVTISACCDGSTLAMIELPTSSRPLRASSMPSTAEDEIVIPRARSVAVVLTLPETVLRSIVPSNSCTAGLAPPPSAVMLLCEMVETPSAATSGAPSTSRTASVTPRMDDAAIRRITLAGLAGSRMWVPAMARARIVLPASVMWGVCPGWGAPSRITAPIPPGPLIFTFRVVRPNSSERSSTWNPEASVMATAGPATGRAAIAARAPLSVAHGASGVITHCASLP